MANHLIVTIQHIGIFPNRCRGAPMCAPGFRQTLFVTIRYRRGDWQIALIPRRMIMIFRPSFRMYPMPCLHEPGRSANRPYISQW
ncbi:hypothetical protein [Xanthocytophaga agilis]|uniref:Uncharacterized protein n=1 Tax=Xanthocytophaga agilis TaxID=3048010 RepID=A0AAE3UB37_9BACT|nr:hypothetical protein [Xanthocytophaga agilis]MDJ1499393.1 hypothetical protein [Xanthocytophaga agilis]